MQFYLKKVASDAFDEQFRFLKTFLGKVDTGDHCKDPDPDPRQLPALLRSDGRCWPSLLAAVGRGRRRRMAAAVSGR